MADTDTENGKRPGPGGLGPVPKDQLLEPPEAVQRNWIWILALGIVLLIGGTLAATMPTLASLAVEIFVGLAMLVGGAIQLVHAFGAEGWRARLWAVLSGAVYLAGGVLLLANPLAGLVALTLVMAAVFTVDGAIRIAMGIGLRPEKGWGWIAAGGVVSVLFGILIIALFPGVSLTLLGIIVAVAMIFEGWGYVFLAIAAKRAQG